MYKHYSLFLFVLYILCGCQADEKTPLTLWYNQPAANWNEALPLGNGRLGAMVYGKTDHEVLQLNDNTLYSGEPATAWKGLDIRPTYNEVESMLRAGKYAEATTFLQKNWLGRLHQNYQPLGEWHVQNHLQGEITGYKRELDIRNSVMRISYTQNGVSYTRELFASAPDGVIVMRLTCDKKDGLDITTSLSSVHPTARQTVFPEGIVAMSGQAPGYVERRSLKQLEDWGFQSKHPELFNPDGSRKFDKQVLYGDEINGMGTFFETRIKVIAPKAQLQVGEEGLRISGTNEVVLVLSSATSFNGFDKSPSREGAPAAKIAEEILDKATKQKYKQLLAKHTEDYKSLFDRVVFEMPSLPEQTALPTDQRIDSFSEKTDPELLTLLFQYGRYLMISGSRPGGQPLNLQGIWNDNVIPPWNSAYTMNINTEMNYWPAELTNLSECHEPLLQMIKEIAITGTETARNMYGRNGWVGHHNVAIWRETYPNDGSPGASYWPMLSAWLCSHYWERYLFSGDELFLRNNVYPLMKGASEFFADWLVDNGEGYLVTPVSTSPENNFFTSEGKRASVSMGCTMDMAMIKELFSRTIEASEKMGVDMEFRTLLQKKLSALLPYRIGSKGQLQEWQFDFKETEPQHRHLSHLYGMHPGNQVSADRTPELFKAIHKTLELRGDEASSWSIGWKMNLWARLLDGNHAYQIVKNFMHPVGFGNNKKKNGGLYLNMLSASPYQIDGNFGYTAGIAEMLLQSHAGYIQLLPALPSEWKNGKISGLRARGGFTIAMEWEGGKIKKATITSSLGGNCRLKTGDEVVVKNTDVTIADGKNPNPLFTFVEVETPQNQGLVPLKDVPVGSCHTIDFMTEKGREYEIFLK